MILLNLVTLLSIVGVLLFGGIEWIDYGALNHTHCIIEYDSLYRYYLQAGDTLPPFDRFLIDNDMDQCTTLTIVK